MSAELDDVQLEVAVHLIANAIRRTKIYVATHPSAAAARRRDDYLRGQLDMLRALHGPAITTAIHNAAKHLEAGNQP